MFRSDRAVERYRLSATIEGAWGALYVSSIRAYRAFDLAGLPGPTTVIQFHGRRNWGRDLYPRIDQTGCQERAISIDQTPNRPASEAIAPNRERVAGIPARRGRSPLWDDHGPSV